MAKFKCGHCGVLSARLGEALVGNNASWMTFVCAACESPTLGRTAVTLENISYVASYFPPQGWERVRNIEKVPAPIAADYEEAVNALIGGLHKASAVMSRRTVQGVCIDLGADPGKWLVTQIDHLGEERLITPKLAALAHQVRVLGNDGAHPGDDGLETVSEEEARQGIEFIEHLLQHVYII